MTPAQVSAIRCAHADLQGALQIHEQCDPMVVLDSDAVSMTLAELEAAFPDLGLEPL